MAREFSKSEIIRQKCSICGSKNKRFTQILQDGKTCGYRLTCCNCNHVDTFYNKDYSTDIGSTTKGLEVCIQVTTCNCKACKYYKKYPLKYAAMLIDRVLNGYGTDCVYDNNMDCKNCEFVDICPNKKDNETENNYCIEKSHYHQLVINGYTDNNPKFH